MPRTPQRFPGSHYEDQSLILADQAADPAEVGEIQRNGNAVRIKDGVAVFDVRGITTEDEGTPVAGAPHHVVNFVGAGVSVADAGSGKATVTITGGGGGSGGVEYAFGGKAAFHKFFGCHGVHNGPVGPDINQETEVIVIADGTLSAISWSTKLGDNTTVWKIHKNSIVAATVTLTGQKGVIDTLNVPVVKGDSIAIEMDSGTLSTESTLRVLVN